MNVLFATAEGEQWRTDLETLVSHFDQGKLWRYHDSAENMRDNLEARGWHDGLTDKGAFLVLDLYRFFQNELNPEHDARAESPIRIC